MHHNQDQVVIDFIDYLKNKKRLPRTIKVYQADILLFIRWLHAHDIMLDALSHEHLKLYSNGLVQHYALTSCLKRKCAALKAFITFAYEQHLTLCDPFTYTWPVFAKATVHDTLGADEVLIQLLQETTINLREIIQLHAHHIHSAHKKICLGNKEFMLSTELAAKLHKLQQHREEHQPLFPYSVKAIKAQLKKWLFQQKRSTQILPAESSDTLTATIAHLILDDYKNYHPRK